MEGGTSKPRKEAGSRGKDHGKLLEKLLAAASSGDIQAVSKAVKAVRAVPFDKRVWKEIVGCGDPLKKPDHVWELAKWTACVKGEGGAAEHFLRGGSAKNRASSLVWSGLQCEQQPLHQQQ